VRALAELAALSLICALLWRAEVEWNGWDGLLWVEYFHWALPAGVLLFWGWVVLRAPATPAHPGPRAVLAVLLPTYAVLVLYNLQSVLFTAHSRLFFLFEGSLWQLASFVGVAALAPAGAYMVGLLCGARLWWPTLPMSWALYLATFPLGIGALLLLEPSRADLVHSVKTGAAVPFAVFAFGLPWALPRATASAPREAPRLP
jgi:hypothetical protein